MRTKIRRDSQHREPTGAQAAWLVCEIAAWRTSRRGAAPPQARAGCRHVAAAAPDGPAQLGSLEPHMARGQRGRCNHKDRDYGRIVSHQKLNRIIMSIVRIEPARSRGRNDDDPSVVERPRKAGRVRQILHLPANVQVMPLAAARSGNDLPSDTFQLNLHGPSIAPRRSLP